MTNYLQELKDKRRNNKPITYKDRIREKLNLDKYSSNRNPIDKMNDNIKLNESIAYYEEKDLEKEEGPTFLGETKRALVGGIRDAAQGVLNLEDTITDYFTKKIPYDVNFSDGVPTIKRMTDEEVEIETSDDPFMLPEVDKNETIAGQIGRDLTRFIAGTFLARGIRTKGLRIKDPKSKGAKFAVNVADSVVGSQLVSAGDEGRLSDILAQIPELTEVPGVGDAIDQLKSNPKDTEAQSRLKMAIEDAVVAFPIEIGVRAAKLLFKGSKDPVRNALSKETVDAAEEAINAKKASDETVDLLENTGNSKALLPDPIFDAGQIDAVYRDPGGKIRQSVNLDIKFKNNEGKDLFETVNDGVGDMVDRIFSKNALEFPVFSNKSTVSSDAFLAFIASSAESTVSLLSAFLTGSFDPLNNNLAALTPISIGKATTASSIAIFSLDCLSVSLGFDFNASIASFTPGTSVSSGICANISDSLPSSPADTNCDPTTESPTLTINFDLAPLGSFIFNPLVRIPLAKNVPAIKRVKSRPI